MKKIVIILTSILTILLFSCGTQNNVEKTESAEEIPKTPIEELTDDESALFEVIRVISESYYVPDSVRLREVGSSLTTDHYRKVKNSTSSSWDYIDSSSETNSLYVCLSAQNIGQSMEYYCITNISDPKNAYYHEYEKYSEGGFYEFKDNFFIEDSLEDTYDIGKINKALKYYWDQRLGND